MEDEKPTMTFKPSMLREGMYRNYVMDGMIYVDVYRNGERHNLTITPYQSEDV
jgi:hypothetical protein